MLPLTAEDAEGRSTQELAWDQLKTCFDPEIPVNIVDLGLVYKCEVAAAPRAASKVRVEFTLTAPGCGMGDFLRQDVEQKLLAIPGVEGGGRAGGARPALGPEHDVRRGAPPAGADVAMKLSSQEEYGLRCLLQLARAGEGASLTIAEMSEREGISAPNVAKIMRILRRAGLVKSTRGQGRRLHARARRRPRSARSTCSRRSAAGSSTPASATATPASSATASTPATARSARC